jgi:hypothetical protein
MIKQQMKIKERKAKPSAPSIFFSSDNSVFLIFFGGQKILAKDFPYPLRKIITARMPRIAGSKAGSISSLIRPPLVRIHRLEVKQRTSRDKINSIIIL